MKLQLLDTLIADAHGTVRSPDCVIAVSAEGLPAPDIARAQKTFPKTGSFPASLSDMRTLGNFTCTRLADPFRIEVAKIREGNLIALKMSHVLGDAVSMFQFLKVLFGEDIADEEIGLKSFPRKKDTPYRDLLTSKKWPRSGPIGLETRFIFETLEHGEQNGRLWNDLLIYSLLEALPFERKSIWIPVNVRKDFWKGFGNGLSRLRVYPPRGANFGEKLAHIRKQKEEAMKNGEVALPPPGFDPGVFHQKLLYDLWIRRPWADWGTISLSHLTNSRGFLDPFRGIRGISSLMPQQNGAIFAVTNGNRTDFTLTYDPAIATDEEARNLLRDFLSNLRAKL